MDARSITYITIEVVIGVASLLGNILVLWAVVINRRLRTVTNLFIVSLAIADMLVGLVAIPCAIASYMGLPENNFYGCVFVNSIVILFTQSSIFSLLAIAGERFVAIKYPYTYERYFTTMNATKLIVATWVLSILIGLVPIMGWNLWPSTLSTCAFTDVIDMKYMVYFNFILSVLMPLLIMFSIYGYIFHIVRQQMRQIAALQIHAHTEDKRKQRTFMKEIKAAKSLAIVIGFFAICWLPIHIMNSITLLCGSDCYQPFELLLAAILLSHANSAVNPFLYAYGNSQFRTTFKRICCCHGLTQGSTQTPSDEVFTISRPYSNDYTNNTASRQDPVQLISVNPLREKVEVNNKVKDNASFEIKPELSIESIQTLDNGQTTKAEHTMSSESSTMKNGNPTIDIGNSSTNIGNSSTNIGHSSTNIGHLSTNNSHSAEVQTVEILQNGQCNGSLSS